uniref:Uncharacterized protein n=1 Tax=Ditylenchus dipsaci TaxID=166011 RepID=A0A915ENM4_9BILA
MEDLLQENGEMAGALGAKTQMEKIQAIVHSVNKMFEESEAMAATVISVAVSNDHCTDDQGKKVTDTLNSLPGQSTRWTSTGIRMDSGLKKDLQEDSRLLGSHCSICVDLVCCLFLVGVE